MQLKKIFHAGLAIAVLAAGSASAAVRPQLTRIIAYTTDKETAVDIVNDSKDPFMVQSWLEDLQGKDTDIPIVLTPPVMKLEGKKQGKLRLVIMKGAVPQDRESVYWLSLQEIPPKAKGVDNRLVVAVRSRLKVFVRPAGFNAEGSRKAAEGLTWSIEKEGNKSWIKASNNAAYYVSFGELAVAFPGYKKKRIEEKSEMVPPKGSARYLLPESYKGGKVTITWSGMHDWGGAGAEKTLEIAP